MGTTSTGKVAVVTGAGSGIGRSLAYGLGRRGCRLAVSDVDEAGLATTEAELLAHGVQVLASRLDVADRDGVAAHAGEIVDRFGVVHQLYNNAGVALADHLTEMTYGELERVLRINLWGVIYGTKEFLPHLISSGDGHLINISSVNAFLPQPGLSAYCASKSAVRGFTEAMRAEMIITRSPVRVTVVHPGGVRTNIATAALEHARSTGRVVTEDDERRTAYYNDKLLVASADSVAEKILNGVARRRARVIVGTYGYRIDMLTRLAPALAPLLGAKLSEAIKRGPG